LRPTRAADLATLAAFLGDRFGRSWTPEEWEWKYRAVPGETRSLVAVDASGSILAHAGALRLPARWQGGGAGIWQLVDFAATPRRQGLRPALVELGHCLLADLPGEEDVPWIFGFPSARHFRLGERVFGYQPLSEVEEWEGEIPEAPTVTPLETGDSCASWAEAVWEACQVPGVRRSAGFLNWRYYARPHRYYRFYRLTSGAAEGLAVFAFVNDEAWAAELWLPRGGEWYPSLLAVAADLRAAGLRRWRFWPPPAGLQLEAVLPALGLQPTGERRFIGCRGRCGGAEGFFYSMGDWDLV